MNIHSSITYVYLDFFYINGVAHLWKSYRTSILPIPSKTLTMSNKCLSYSHHDSHDVKQPNCITIISNSKEDSKRVNTLPKS